MKLDEAIAASGRNNNFNLVRLVAAFCVIVSHSAVLTTGDAHLEPLTQLLGVNLGQLSVAAFFITSGFLVGGSLLGKGDPVRYVLARVFRIYPGLVAAVLFTMLIGAAFTTESLSAYLLSSETGKYMLRTGSALLGVAHTLPGVFQGNPYPQAVNGSLWTLPHELRMYALLLLAWFAARVFRADRWLPVGLAAVAAVTLVAYWASSAPIHELSRVRVALWLVAMFFLGVTAFSVRDRLSIRPMYAVGAALTLVVAAAISHTAFRVVYPVAMTYLILFVVYGLPPIRALLKSDYSYGVYVYAFPVQQAVAALVPGVSAWAMTAICTPIVLLLAALSWYCIERPTLRAVDPAASRLKSLTRRTA